MIAKCLFLLFFIGFSFVLSGCIPSSPVSEQTLQRLIDVSAGCRVWNWENPEQSISEMVSTDPPFFQVAFQDVSRNALVLTPNTVFSDEWLNSGAGRLEFWAAGVTAPGERFVNEIPVGVTVRCKHREVFEVFRVILSPTADQSWQKFDLRLQDMSGPATCEFRIVPDSGHAVTDDLQVFIGSPVFIPETKAPLPNVVIVCMDSLRADELGGYGSSLANSPTMDRLAQNGVVYAGALSSSCWTVPGVKNLLAGRYTWLDQFETDRIPDLSEDPNMMLQDYFARAGYYTAAVIANPLLTRRLGFERGFDVFDTFAVRSWMEGSHIDIYHRIEHTVANHHDRPLFLYLHLMDPHDPYVSTGPFLMMNDTPPDNAVRPFIRKKVAGPLNHEPNKTGLQPLSDVETVYLRSHYRNLIRQTDSILDAVLQLLHIYTDFPDNTILMVTSDHGEEFLEHGYYQHGFTIYESAVRVPWIMHFPPAVSSNRVIDGWVSIIDMPATISELVFSETLPTWQGRSVYPQIPEPIDIRTVFTAVRSVDEPTVPRIRWRAVYRGNRKLLWSPENVTGYDLVRYPSETPVFQYHDFDTLKTHLSDMEWHHMASDLLAFMNQFAGHEPPEISDDLAAQLRELGYIQ